MRTLAQRPPHAIPVSCGIRLFVRLCAVVLASTALATGLVAAPGQQAVLLQERAVDVTVRDGDGRPVSDLTAQDFSVREAGVVRPVIAAAPSTRPLALTIIVNDKGSDINEIRRGVAILMQRIQGYGSVSLISTAPTVEQVLDFTESPSAMIAGIQRLRWRSGPSTGMLLTAIADAARALQAREGARRAMVVVHFEGEESRNQKPPQGILETLERHGIRLHVVAVGRPVVRRMLDRATMNAMESNSEVASRQADRGDDWVVDEQNREAVLGEGPRRTGGRRHNITTAQGLSAVLQEIAADILHQYTVVYTGSATAGPKRLEITVNRKGTKLLAPATPAS